MDTPGVASSEVETDLDEGLSKVQAPWRPGTPVEFAGSSVYPGPLKLRT